MNSKLIREWLRNEGRKHSYVCNRLGISSSLLDKMLGGRVPREETVNALAALIGVSAKDLLIPRVRTAKAG